MKLQTLCIQDIELPQSAVLNDSMPNIILFICSIFFINNHLLVFLTIVEYNQFHMQIQSIHISYATNEHATYTAFTAHSQSQHIHTKVF